MPTVEHTQKLDVTFDPLLNFGEHAKNLKEKTNVSNNILKVKSLAGSTSEVKKRNHHHI